jgi:ribosomal protein L35AE/L33A
MMNDGKALDVTNLTVHHVCEFIRQNASRLTVGEREQIIMEIRISQQRSTERAKAAIGVGDQVQFVSSRTGEMLKGVVQKINTKTVQVYVATTKQTWRVAPTLLKNAA